MFWQGFLALLGQTLPSDPGILLVDSEKQDLMGEGMAKCEGINVPFHHVKVFLRNSQTFCDILINAPITLFAENSFVALFWAFLKNKELVVKRIGQ